MMESLTADVYDHALQLINEVSIRNDVNSSLVKHVGCGTLT